MTHARGPSKLIRGERSHGKARGVKSCRGTQIAIRFDNDTFAKILGRANHYNTSFAEQVRQLVEDGLEHNDFPAIQRPADAV